jgi:N-methylhydantoinase B
MFANVATQSVEVCEREQPLEVLCFEFWPDSGGAGAFRGGMGLRRDYRFLEAEGVLQVRADRCRFRPYGLAGGQPAQLTRNTWQPGTVEEQVLPGKFIRPLRRGDCFRHEQSGAGGWGDPLTRAPALVLRDVRNEFVSLTSAERDYGVIIDPATLTVDEARTAALRRQRAAPAAPAMD